MPDSWDDSMAGGQNIRFEETLNMRDETGAKPYIKYVYLVVVFLIVNAVVGGTLIPCPQWIGSLQSVSST